MCVLVLSHLRYLTDFFTILVEYLYWHCKGDYSLSDVMCNGVFQVFVSMLDSVALRYTQKLQELVDSVASKIAATQVRNLRLSIAKFLAGFFYLFNFCLTLSVEYQEEQLSRKDQTLAVTDDIWTPLGLSSQLKEFEDITS